MSRFYSVSIPVKPHIEKFFRAREGHPIRSSDQSMIWLTIRPYLIYKRSDGYSSRQRSLQLHNLKGSLKVQLSLQKVKLYGLEARPASIILMNMVLDHYFGRELYWFVQSCISSFGRYRGIKAAVENFCKLYDIELEEDISLNTILQIYKRQHQNELKKIGAKKILPAARA